MVSCLATVLEDDILATSDGCNNRYQKTAKFGLSIITSGLKILRIIFWMVTDNGIRRILETVNKTLEENSFSFYPNDLVNTKTLDYAARGRLLFIHLDF